MTDTPVRRMYSKTYQSCVRCLGTVKPGDLVELIGLALGKVAHVECEEMWGRGAIHKSGGK